MPRVSYAAPSPRTAEQISLRRGGALTPLDLLLSHNDSLALGWDRLVGGVRSNFSISGDVRELIILRIGKLNGADYEWDAHLPVALREGLPRDVINRLASGESSTGSANYDAVLRLVDAMTEQVAVPQEVFTALGQLYTEPEIVELTATVAVYNMVSRFLVALDVKTADRVELAANGGGHA